MGKRELDILLSLSDRIPDDFLRTYLKEFKRLFQKSSPEFKLMDLNSKRKTALDREKIFKVIAESRGRRERFFPKFIIELQSLGIKPYIEHLTYQTSGAGRSTRAHEIVKAFTEARRDQPWDIKKHKDEAVKQVFDMLVRRNGGPFCAFMNNIDNEKVLGTGSFGAVFTVDNLVHKIFYSESSGGMDGRGQDPMQELIMLSFATALAEEENNPHMTRLVEANVCVQEIDLKNESYPFRYLFLTMEPISGTLAGVWSSLQPRECKSLFFQHLKACQFLISHGIVHFDMHASNLGYEDTDVEDLDYSDGWGVPTFGRIAKVMDFGRADRYIDPVYRTRFYKSTPMPYDDLNPANDPLSVVYTYRHILEIQNRLNNDDEIVNCVRAAAQFCENEFGQPFDKLVGVHPIFSLVTNVKSDDVTFVDRLMEAVFPEYRV